MTAVQTAQKPLPEVWGLDLEPEPSYAGSPPETPLERFRKHSPGGHGHDQDRHGHRYGDKLGPGLEAPPWAPGWATEEGLSRDWGMSDMELEAAQKCGMAARDKNAIPPTDHAEEVQDAAIKDGSARITAEALLADPEARALIEDTADRYIAKMTEAEAAFARSKKLDASGPDNPASREGVRARSLLNDAAGIAQEDGNETAMAYAWSRAHGTKGYYSGMDTPRPHANPNVDPAVLRDHMVKQMAYDVADVRQRAWAHGSSGGDSPFSVRMQKAVKEEFGATGSAWISKTHTKDIYRPTKLDRAYVRVQYKVTQSRLTKDTYHLYRGQGSDADSKALSGLPRDRTYSRKVASNPLSSWSRDQGVAKDFANRSNGVIYAAAVPKARIFSASGSGLGCSNEQEFVVIGANGTVLVDTWR